MSDTVGFNAEDVKRLVCTQQHVQSERPVLADIWEVNRILNKLAFDFEHATLCLKEEWDDLPLSERNLLAELAYKLIESDDLEIEPPSTRLRKKFFSNPISLARNLQYGIVLFLKHGSRFLKMVTDYGKANEHLNTAKYNFADFVLSAVERDDPSYRQFLSDTLEELEQLQGECSSELNSLEPGEIDGWLQRLSDKALEEV